MKAIIEALKQKCLSSEEIEKVIISIKFNIKKDNLRKTRVRDLERLIYYGLVEKRGGKYCWYIYQNWFENYEDYYIKLEHSRQLIPGLEELAGLRVNRVHLAAPHDEYVNPYDLEILTNCAKEHLMSYNDIYPLLEDYRVKNKKNSLLKDQLEEDLKGKLRIEFGEPIDVSARARTSIFVGSNIPLIISANLLYGSTTNLELRGEEIRAHGQAGGVVIAKGSKLFEKLEEFIKRETEDNKNVEIAEKIRDNERICMKAYGKLKEDMRKLIIRINSGETLRGRCDTCPEVYITTARAREIPK